jgi:hypothetical protein
MITRLLIATAALSLIAMSAASASTHHHHHHHHAHRVHITPYAYGFPSYAGAASVAAGNWSCWMGPDLQCHTVDGGTIWDAPDGNQRLP